jgi:hypothetical protein
MASPNPETDERNMKNKDNTKLAKIKNPADSCVLRMPFLAENTRSVRQLFRSIFFREHAYSVINRPPIIG